MKSFLRWSARLLALILILTAAAVATVFVILRRSLPDTEGVVKLEGLASPVGITRDALGIPMIDASNREDAARALGFLHGQERFFQMDLLRRSAAGELSGLFGSLALRADRAVRIHRFRSEARAVVAAMEPRERAILNAYAEGVASGLSKLGSRPFEYWILRASPEPWRPEDSILVNFAMWLDLQESNGEPDRSRAVVRDLFPPDVAAYLLSAADPFEAPIDGSVIEAPPLPSSPGPVPVLTSRQPEVPGVSHETASTIDGRLFDALFPRRDPEYAVGSNSWAVAGTRTASGGALVANDMHLGLRVPHIWYRASMKVGSSDSAPRVTGVTLPGTPVFIVGSNGRVAWGFTNAEIDSSDVVLIETDPADPSRYLTPDGPRAFEDFEETIPVKGGKPETAKVRWTQWGPVLGDDHRGRTIALKWTAHEPGAANLNLMKMEDAQTTADALRIAQAAGMPNQNCISGDNSGIIGWTIAGRIPHRVGMDGTTPVSFANGTGWDGWLAEDDVPRVIDPADGILWSANARVVGGEALAKLGDGGYAPSSRAREIRDRLSGIDEATPAAMLALQLDSRAIQMDFWRDLLVNSLAADAASANTGHARMRELALQWGGEAVAESAGYRLIREYRRKVVLRVTDAIFARCRAAYPSFTPYQLVTERIVRDLVIAKPPAWLPADHPGWDALLLESADVVIADAGGETALEQYVWGGYNRLSMRHPLGGALPVVGRFLDMKPTPMNGDANIVNAQLRGHGASERMAVTPGHESEGILHMPGGQSGNPLSSHYGDSHADWLRGEPTPFLPGTAINNLLLTP